MKLEKLKFQNEIIRFNWLNKSKESSYPYDFEIHNLNGNVVFTDVKTTSYRFEQSMIFSKSELSFISQNSNYHINHHCCHINLELQHQNHKYFPHPMSH